MICSSSCGRRSGKNTCWRWGSGCVAQIPKCFSESLIRLLTGLTIPEVAFLPSSQQPAACMKEYTGKADTAVNVTKSLKETFPGTISAPTIRRGLKKSGLKAMVKTKDPVCHGMTSPPSFSISFLFHSLPLPSSTYFWLHLTPSTCPLPPLHQLQGIPMQLHYVHCQTSPGLMLDLLRSSSHAKGYCLYTFVQFVWSFFIGNNG